MVPRKIFHTRVFPRVEPFLGERLVGCKFGFPDEHKPAVHDTSDSIDHEFRFIDFDDRTMDIIMENRIYAPPNLLEAQLQHGPDIVLEARHCAEQSCHILKSRSLCFGVALHKAAGTLNVLARYSPESSILKRAPSAI